MADNPLILKPGTRLRTGGATYEVTDEASVPAGVVPVVPQPARLLKVFCTSCGYTARITQRWITKSGTPDCPGCHINMVVEVKGEAKPESLIENEPSELDALLADVEPESDEPSALAALLSEL